MTERRALADLLIEIAGGYFGVAALPGLRVTTLQLALPIDVQMARTTDGPEFRAELPRFVTSTSFDRAPDRLTVRWAEEIAS